MKMLMVSESYQEGYRFSKTLSACFVSYFENRRGLFNEGTSGVYRYKPSDSKFVPVEWKGFVVLRRSDVFKISCVLYFQGMSAYDKKRYS